MHAFKLKQKSLVTEFCHANTPIISHVTLRSTLLWKCSLVAMTAQATKSKQIKTHRKA